MTPTNTKNDRSHVNRNEKSANTYSTQQPSPDYFDDQQNSNENDSSLDYALKSTSTMKSDIHRTEIVSTTPVAIRRHAPGSTDPTMHSLTPRSTTPGSSLHIPIQRYPNKALPPSILKRTHASIPVDPDERHPSVMNSEFNPKPVNSSNYLDPDERPIKPMKDKSVYQLPLHKRKMNQPKKPLPKPKPIQYSPTPEPETPRMPPIHSRMKNISTRRPVRTDLAPRISTRSIPPLHLTPSPQPPPKLARTGSRRIIIEEYDDYDIARHRPYVKPKPTTVVSYQPVRGLTTRELENYQMSKARRIVYVQTPPIRTVVYRP